jgi:RimJ/RimL family protein N-acetyltransferase
MPEQPTLRTDRLILRPFAESDGPRVVELAGAREIADTTLSIPHPYPPDAATSWIAGQLPAWVNGIHADFAITDKATGDLFGAIGQGINRMQDHGEMGYWIGLPYWNNGYCTEAARAVVAFAFTELGLHRVYAHHLVRNPASGKVMQKIGMRFEGIHRDHVKKWDKYEDIAAYAILADEWGQLPHG